MTVVQAVLLLWLLKIAIDFLCENRNMAFSAWLQFNSMSALRFYSNQSSKSIETKT